MPPYPRPWRRVRRAASRGSRGGSQGGAAGGDDRAEIADVDRDAACPKGAGAHAVDDVVVEVRADAARGWAGGVPAAGLEPGQAKPEMRGEGLQFVGSVSGEVAPPAAEAANGGRAAVVVDVDGHEWFSC